MEYSVIRSYLLEKPSINFSAKGNESAKIRLIQMVYLPSHDLTSRIHLFINTKSVLHYQTFDSSGKKAGLMPIGSLEELIFSDEVKVQEYLIPKCGKVYLTVRDHKESTKKKENDSKVGDKDITNNN